MVGILVDPVGDVFLIQNNALVFKSTPISEQMLMRSVKVILLSYCYRADKSTIFFFFFFFLLLNYSSTRNDLPYKFDKAL